MNKYEILLFIVARNSISPKGFNFNKSEKEIDLMTIDVIEEMAAMVDWNIATKIYERAKKAAEERNNDCPKPIESGK